MSRAESIDTNKLIKAPRFPLGDDTLDRFGAPELDVLFRQAELVERESAWFEHVPFANWLMRAANPRILVELGTHTGVSYAAFCQAVVADGLGTRCYAVDTWKGDIHAGFYPDEVFHHLKDYHDRRFPAFSQMLRCTFDDARDMFSDGSVDLLHIDGLHTYEAVRHDFDGWLPKLSNRAVVLFHDTNERRDDFGVWRLWAEVSAQWQGFEFAHGHGLGVLCVGTDVPESVRALCDLSEVRAAAVKARFARLGERWAVESRALALGRGIAAYENRIGAMEAAKAAAEAGLHAANDELSAVKASLQALLAERVTVAERDAQIADLSGVVAEKQRQAADLTREVAEFEKRVVRFDRALAERDRQISALNRGNGERDREIASLRQVVAERDREIDRVWQTVALREAQLAGMVSSTSWQMTMPVRATMTRLPGSMRQAGRRLLKLAWWAVTPQRIPARLRARRARPGAEPLPVPAPPVVQDPPPPVAQPLSDIVGRLDGDNTPALDWYDPVAPEVSVVVLNWNRSDLTLLCLDHLWQRTTGHRYEVIVVDNGSRPDDLLALRNKAVRARIISVGTNRYFGEANNIGVEAARGRYICFLNNDAFVHENWLEPLVAMLESDPRNGAVGPRFLYPDGRLQEAGALVNPDGSVVQLGKGEAGADSRFADVRQVDYVSAACVLVRRSEFLSVLGFDLAWDPAYYEDVDLCLKLRLAGLRTFFCPDSTVTHIENATSSDASHGLRLENIIAINKAKFVARWEGFLKTSGDERPNLLIASPGPVMTGTGKPRVLIYTPYDLTPGGGERYVLTIAEAFRDVAEVVLVTPIAVSRIRVLTMGREFGLQLDQISQICLTDVADQPPFDLSFVVSNAICPPVNGKAAHNIFICQFPFPMQDENYLHLTRPLWDDYDMLLTYSSFVRQHAVRASEVLDLPHRPIEILAPPVPLLPLGREKQAKILHVGRFFTGGHCKRQDILIDAVRTLVEAGVKTELHLAGSVHPEAQHRAYYADLVEKAKGLPVYFHANCSAEKLQELYSTSRVYWHATGFGHDVEIEPQLAEHFGISVVEAMSAGCIPVVFAAGGPADIVTHGVTGFHFRTVEELCAITRTLLENTSDEAMGALEDAAVEAARSYDEESFKTQVRTLASRFMTI